MRIDVNNVSKQFGEFTALQDVTLSVAEGSLTALLGPSGSGKSTLLRIVAGLETPDRGQVLIDGADVTAARPQDRGVGFVFQHYAAFTHMTVRPEDPQAPARRDQAARRRALVAGRAHDMVRAAPRPALRRTAPADGAGAGARG